MAHAHCMLDTEGYKYKHSGRVILHRISTVTLVARTRLNVTSYVHCLSYSGYVCVCVCVYVVEFIL